MIGSNFQRVLIGRANRITVPGNSIELPQGILGLNLLSHDLAHPDPQVNFLRYVQPFLAICPTTKMFALKLNTDWLSGNFTLGEPIVPSNSSNLPKLIADIDTENDRWIFAIKGYQVT